MLDNRKFTQLIQDFLPDAQLLKVSSLTGGISAQTSLLEVRRSDGEIQKFVVRQHGARDRATNPKIAFDEYRLLERLSISDVPVAKPYYVDDTIFDVPCIVLDYIHGKTAFSPEKLTDCIREMAATLARIHSIPDASTTFDFLPAQPLRYSDKLANSPKQVDDSLHEGRIRDILAPVWELPQLNQTTLLHGDYWSSNVLWQDDELAAVIDWEDAMLGDPLADLGDSRLATLWSFGRDALHIFTDHYQAKMPQLDYRHLAYWDLCAALRPISRFSDWATDADHEQSMRREHQWFVNQAIAALG